MYFKKWVYKIEKVSSYTKIKINFCTSWNDYNLKRGWAVVIYSYPTPKWEKNNLSHQTHLVESVRNSMIFYSKRFFLEMHSLGTVPIKFMGSGETLHKVETPPLLSSPHLLLHIKGFLKFFFLLIFI